MVNQHFENIIFNKKNIFLRSWSTNNDPIYNIIIIHGLGEHSGRYKEFASFFIKKNDGQSWCKDDAKMVKGGLQKRCKDVQRWRKVNRKIIVTSSNATVQN